MENPNLINRLIQKDEDLCLEFKSFWYWSSESKKEKGWNEFLKDFISMFNTYNDSSPSRYFIFGYDEKTQEFNDYFRLKNDQILEELKNIEELKDTLNQKLMSTCIHSSTFNNFELKDFYEFEQYEVNEKNILLLTIHFSPFYLILNRDLSDGMKKNVIPIRSMQENSPRNAIINNKDLINLKRIVENNEKNLIKHEKRTIKKIVEAFQTKHLPSAKVQLINELRQKLNIYYELFEIKSDLYDSQIFIYITSFTSQEKTINHIYDEFKELLENSSNIFILVDEHNRTGGTIDLERIEKLFKEKISRKKGAVKVERLESFSENRIYKEELSEEIFSIEKPSSHTEYISPNIKVENSKITKSEVFFDNWIKNDESSILLIKGTGGVGKTTVARQFIYKIHNKNKINKKNNTKFLFINSHDIINELMSKGKINDLFDFYQVLAEVYDTEKRFNKHTFSLSADNGNLVIVLDGIDEVIAKKGSDFDITKFMHSITTDYLGSLGKTKIILTCRDSFWSSDSIESNNIKEIEILPFNSNLATSYFSKIFNDINKQKKAMDIASDYKINDCYVPYILDMIRELIINNDEELDAVDFESSLLKSEINKHDFLIGKVCEREINKLDNTSIDEQLEIFMEMALRYSGSLNKRQLKELLEKKYSDRNFSKFNAHPLLKENDEILTFRYDFFEEYFKELALSIFFESDIVRVANLDEYLIDIIKNYINFDNDFVSIIKNRISDKEKFKEDLFLLLLELIELKQRQSSDIIYINRKNLISAFFILLILNNESNKNMRTNLLKDIFMKGEYIENLSLINLHSTNKKVNFDFKGLKFNNCHFENFENFLECDFDESTFFRNCSFLPKLRKNSNITSSLTPNNVDNSTCRYDGLQPYFEEIKERGIKEKDLHDKFLRDVIKFFWKGVGFKILPKQSVNNKFKNHNELLKKLISISFLKEKKVTTTRERMEPHYYIEESFNGVRKIMEQNRTCIEFERLKKLMRD